MHFRGDSSGIFRQSRTIASCVPQRIHDDGQGSELNRHAEMGMSTALTNRCYRCLRPRTLCYCQALPTIQNRTAVLMLQHVGERFHPFNTARMAHLALQNSRLLADHNRHFAQRELPLGPNSALLYPSRDAPSLEELSPADRPPQLVVIDGTWHQAKTIVRDTPQLQDLPRYRLHPAAPGQYRIRREPTRDSLSTVEAIVAALGILEPSTPGLSQLLAAFHGMIDEQLKIPLRGAVPRSRTRPPRPRYVPQALHERPHSIVVAYGESAPVNDARGAKPVPLSWVARRLASNDHFEQLIRPDERPTEAVLQHMRLSAADFEGALSEEAFIRAWRRFTQPDDLLVVYHRRTHQLLANLGLASTSCLVLKSIYGNLRSDFRTLEELARREGVDYPLEDGMTRAAHRLELAIRLVRRVLRREEYRR